ncbi:MAG: hypothetical protein J0I69_04895 [Altererythrobacter sp.]|nr:hypothetical protein [Altererythrobacter sp.]
MAALRLAGTAARYGIDLHGWDADWLGARLFLAGIGRGACASAGPVEGLD